MHTKPLLILLLLCLALPCMAQPQDSLRYKIAQMLMIGFRGTTLTPTNHIYTDIAQHHIGGVILFDWDAPSGNRVRNIESPVQLKQLCTDLQTLSGTPLLVAIDQEGGRVNRLKQRNGFPRTVSAQYLGKVNHMDTTALYANSTAATLKSLGFNVNFVPCVDLNINPTCPVIGKVERSFSANPATVVAHSKLWIDAHRRQGILTSPKHFPGHGSSTTDSHLGLTNVSRTWTEAELEPYKQLIAANYCDMVMVSHVYNRHWDADYPATMSYKVITGILRNKLGYTGLVITDDMAMGAIVDHYSLATALEKSVNAGVDILILSNNGKSYDPLIATKAIDILERLVRKGTIAPGRIEEAYRRISQAKAGLGK